MDYCLHCVLYRREHGYDPACAAVYIDKWGPCIRTAIALCSSAPSAEYSHEITVKSTVDDMWENSARLSTHTLDGASERSSVVFIRPRLGDDKDTTQRLWARSVPTTHLRSIVESKRKHHPNETVLRLLALLNPRSYTRSAAGWAKTHLHRRRAFGAFPDQRGTLA